MDSSNWKRTIICHQAKHSAIVYFLSPLRKYVCKYACVCVCGVYLSQQNNAVINGICCLKGVLFDFMLNFFLLFFHFVWPEGIFCSKLCAKHAHTHPCIYTYTYLSFFFFIIILKFFLFYILFSVLAALLQPSVAALTAFTHRCEEKNKIYIYIYTHTHLKKFQCPPAAGICVLKITTKKKKQSATTTKNRQIKV